MRNKKGDVESIIFLVMFLFMIGVILFLFSYLNNEIYTEMNNTLGGSHTNQTIEVLDTVISNNNSIWDYVFLGIFMGSLISIALSAYAIRISPVFYWIYGLLSMVVLAMGTMLSNIWQDMVVDGTFATTLSRFPITNAVLGTYYPIIVTAVVILAMIIIFGKPAGTQREVIQ